MVSAHKRQLKFCDESRRKTLPSFVFHGETERQGTRKRRREEMADLSSSESEPDFYGFAAESFIYGEEDSNENEVPESEAIQDLRRSKRKLKKKRKSEYEYY